MSDQKLTITYENKVVDVFNFAIYHFTRSAYMLGLFVVIFLMRNMKLITATIQEPALPLSFVVMNLTIDIFAMAAIFLVSFPIVFFFTYYQKNKSLFTTYTLSLNDDTLIEQSPHGKVEVNYHSIFKIRDTKKLR